MILRMTHVASGPSKQHFPFRTLRIVLPWMCDREHNGKNSLLILFQKRKGISPI
jgi:hypothetical protein